MNNRTALMHRVTKETDIEMSLTLDSKCGKLNGSSGIGFFDHMLNSFCVHGGFEITLNMKGDLTVDGHHSVEDIGIVLGKLFAQILGDRSGINRFGCAEIPMDEALAKATLDISGREYLVFNAEFSAPMIGDYDTQLTKEFFRAFANNMGLTLHINLIYGDNDHHKVEAIFKAVARALKSACETNDGAILSAKGVL